MKKLLALLLASLMLLSVLAGCEKSPEETASPETDAPETEAPAAPNSIYVAPDGDDAAAGTIDAPLATLDGARLKVRSLLPEAKEPVTVYFRGGDYYMEKGVVFDEEDSGTEAAPVTYKAYEGETVRFLGAKKVDPSKIAPADDTFKDRLNDENAKTSLLMADVSDYVDVYPEIWTVKNPGDDSYNPVIVYLGEDRLTLSRWPNYVDDRATDNYVYFSGKTHVWYEEDDTNDCFYGDDIAARVATWSDESIGNMTVYGCFTWTWLLERYACLSVNREEQYFHFTGGVTSVERWAGRAAGGKVAFENLPEEIDVPLESYADTAARVVYFLPTEDYDPDDVFVATLTEPMLTLNGTDFITFDNLSFLYTRKNIVYSDGSEGLTFSDCVMAHTSARAGYFENSKDLHVDGCEIYDLSQGGLVVFGGDRNTLTSSGFVFENCEIHHFNQDGMSHGFDLDPYLWTSGFSCNPALALYAVGAVVRHNVFHHSIHQVISPTSNNILIEYNEFYDCLTECSDMGAIYYANNPTLLGLTVRYNYFHDMGNVYDGVGTCCVYSDEGSVGAEIYGNLFVRAAGVPQETDRPEYPRFCILLGQFGHTHNNIFVDVPAVHRYGDWSDGTGRRQSRYILYLYSRGSKAGNNAKPRFYDIDFESDIWHAAYDGTIWGRLYECFSYELADQFAELDDDAAWRKAASMAPYQTNETDHNLLVNVRDIVNEPDNYRLSLKLHDNLEDGDPSLFVDYENGDYNLTEAGLALVRESCPGFEPLPLDQIGPRE